MLHETDLPCTDCGSALEEQTVTLSERERTNSNSGKVPIAICPQCGARHYPENALSKLSGSAESHSREGVEL